VGRMLKYVIFALLMSAAGLYLGTRSGLAPEKAKVKSAEEYWAETELSSHALEELLGEDSCQSSERYFLACVNALESSAARFGLHLSQDGHWQASMKSEKSPASEKTTLAPWKALLSAKKEIPELPFLNLWRDFVAHHLKTSQISYAVGLGMNGFLSVFRDPHTYLLPADMYAEVVAKANPQSVSIGVVMGRNDTHYFIKKVIENSPSDQAGLKKGDLLLTLAGKEAANLSAQELGDLLRGEAGSVLEMEVLHHQEFKKITIHRREQALPTVSAKLLEGSSSLGVLTVNKFAIGACQQVKHELENLKTQGMRGLLLDLRDNPGGQMDEATCVAGLFVGPDKKIYDIRGLHPGADEESSFSSEAQVYQGPMAVLVNAGSASAAEIVAGVLRDYQRAVLVGERTFGKGSFQEGEIWAKNGKIAIFETKGFYYLPSGQSPQRTGIEPDVKVSFLDRFALREEDQFLNPLKAPPLKPSALPLAGNGWLAVSHRSLPVELGACLSYESDTLPPEDPEIKEAHRILHCRLVAERGRR